MIMMNSNTVNNFNLNAPASIAFRFLQVHNQLEHNMKNLTNEALKSVVYEIVCKIYKSYVSMGYKEENSPQYLDIADTLFEYITNQKVFLNQLVDVLDKNHHDYGIMKYCALVLNSTDYILGTDTFDEPEE